MLFRWFFWKFLRLSFLICFIFTFLFLVFQVIKLDQILFRLPPNQSFPFLLLWLFYYFSYMLPLSLFIAFSLSLFEFKESKKLHIIQSFGIKASHLYTKSIMYMFPILLALVVSSFLVNEDHIGYLRRQLTLKYYTLMLTSIPPKSFQTFGQFTLYVEGRDGSRLEGIFFKFQEGVVIAKGAYVKDEEIIFEKGSLLTQREGKTFSTDFDTYRLNLKMVMPKENIKKMYTVSIVNALSPLFLLAISYLLVQVLEYHHRFYYMVGLISILYELMLFLLKQKL
uniref:LptF/LptG family permease n=1 Tax=Hydrogenobacter sp. TaxID=2152829 RepID=A0A7C2ZFN0_9AQUI